MYYYCAKHAFKLPDLSERTPAGGIIAAAAMPYPQLARRSIMPVSHLIHRLFDPQLYLSTLDPRTAPGTVYKLATYPWFGSQPATYDSAQHGSLDEYKNRFINELHLRWPSQAPIKDQAILDCVRTGLEFQVKMGCEGLIIPSPLTNTVTDYHTEIKYLDAAVSLAPELPAHLPIYATVALSDGLLRNTDPAANTVVRVISDNIAARSEISGAYIVLEQTAETGYVCTNEQILFALLILSDDIARGAGKEVIVNYMGPFGAVMLATGATTWSSGYYRSQRRMRLADQEEDTGRAYPRFYSSALAGDVGVEEDLQLLKENDLLQRIFSRSRASRALLNAIARGRYPEAAPQWQYRPTNISAAAAHYNDICCKLDSYLDTRDLAGKIEAVERWLTQATVLSRQAMQLGVSKHTDLRHQEIWLSAFAKWRSYAGF